MKQRSMLAETGLLALAARPLAAQVHGRGGMMGAGTMDGGRLGGHP